MTPSVGAGSPRATAASRLFREQARADFHHVGAIAPSGSRLAEALAAGVSSGGGEPRRILEVGAGTGAVTAAIVARLGAADTLLVVERNPVFVACLRDLAESRAEFRRLGDRLRIVHADIAALEVVAEFHTVVSSLPFNNFASDEVAEHLRRFRGLLVSGGSLVFFEYLGVRKVRGLISSRRERERLRGVGRAIGTSLKSMEATSRIVWWNVPPAVVHAGCWRVS